MHAHARPRRPASSKPQWAALGALGVAVLALAATLIYIQLQPAEPNLAVVPAVTPASVEAAPAPTTTRRAER